MGIGTAVADLVAFGFIILVAFVSAMMIVLAIRNEWVCKRRIRFINTCNSIIRQLINESQVSEYCKIPTCSDWVEALWSYDKSVFYFWIWDMEKMIADKEKYAEFKALEVKYAEYIEKDRQNEKS